MPKRRANGEGNIRKRKDGRWEGRYTAGYDANGKAITKNVLGRTQAEVKDKLRAAIEDSKKLDPVKAGSYTPVSYTHLTLPTNREVKELGGVVLVKKKKEEKHRSTTEKRRQE